MGDQVPAWAAGPIRAPLPIGALGQHPSAGWLSLPLHTHICTPYKICSHWLQRTRHSKKYFHSPPYPLTAIQATPKPEAKPGPQQTHPGTGRHTEWDQTLQQIPLQTVPTYTGYTIMWKTSDLAVIQKTIIDTFTRRVSHKHSLPKKLAVHRALYPSMLTESRVDGKDGQPTERTATSRDLSSKIHSRIWVNVARNGLRLRVKASRATTHRRVKEFGYSCRIPLVKPLPNHRQCQRCLTRAKEKKNWTVTQWLQSPLFR
uniref:Uncharacterized protein n=1 Tax=Leptobrachium leishanense TaxID=445787 RepID=A0A8C5Q2N7_9ANUR